MSEFKKDESEIGSLWLKTGAKGQYMTGDVSGVKVICFPVNSENPKAPAWRVKKQQPREDRPQGETLAGGFQVEARENIGTDRDDLGF